MMFFLVLVMLASCTAAPTDLTGKMFTFPQATNTARVKLLTLKNDFKAVTVCLRSFTDLRRDHTLFSLSTPFSHNDFLIFKDATNNNVKLCTRDTTVDYNLDYKLSSWSSVCGTWDAASGLGQLWMDGKPSVKKFISSNSNIGGTPIILLGQEQDSHGGGFDPNQSFVGMMSDVHMWDYVLSSCEIQKYVDELNFTPGNVLNWKALDFQIVDRVLIEDKQKTCSDQ